MEARPKGFDPIAVEDSADDIYKAVSEAAKKLERSTQHFVERHHSR
jgi:ribosome-associated translation inhibitor RaiA